MGAGIAIGAVAGLLWGVRRRLGWPTTGSVAVSVGAVHRFADRWPLLGIEAGTAALVLAVLIKAGVTRRLERWSREPGDRRHQRSPA